MTKILLVEDDKNLREIYGTRLYAEGYDVVSAGDGEQALAMAIKERPNLIISDVMMPKISGFDMLDILHSTTETKNIKVIMMTALSSEDQRARGEALGADRYLVKSQVGIEDVVRTVHDVLGDAPGSGSVSQPATATSATAIPTPQVIQPQQTPVVTQPIAAPMTQNPQMAMSSPVPASIPAPQAATPQPTAAPQPVSPPATQMPQPTAPFSTARPATLGERVIQPIEHPVSDQGADISAKLADELSLANDYIETPIAEPLAPQPVAQPISPAPIPQPVATASTTIPTPIDPQQQMNPPAATTDDIAIPPLPHVPDPIQTPPTSTPQ